MPAHDSTAATATCASVQITPKNGELEHLRDSGAAELTANEFKLITKRRNKSEPWCEATFSGKAEYWL